MVWQVHACPFAWILHAACGCLVPLPALSLCESAIAVAARAAVLFHYILLRYSIYSTCCPGCGLLFRPRTLCAQVPAVALCLPILAPAGSLPGVLFGLCVLCVPLLRPRTYCPGFYPGLRVLLRVLCLRFTLAMACSILPSCLPVLGVPYLPLPLVVLYHLPGDIGCPR